MMVEGCHILPLSAETREQLEDKKREVISFLNKQVPLEKISQRLLSEEPLRHRMAVVASEHKEAETLIEETDSFDSSNLNNKIIFAFPGQGAAGAIPLKYLRNNLKEFDFYITTAENILNEESISISEILSSWKHNSSVEEQLFSFVFGIGMAKQYLYDGVNPEILIGHSLGEITAAVVSETLSFEEALIYVLKRAKLMDSIKEKGVMCALSASEKEIEKILARGKDLSLAAVNAHALYVISGRKKDILKAESEMDKLEIKHKRLKVTLAAHSSLLDPILLEIEKIGIKNIREGKYPQYSSLSGALLDINELRESDWWSRHTRSTVSFASALSSMEAAISPSKPIVVEFGVHRVLMSGGMETLKDSYWTGCCSMSKYHENKSPEYCYKRGYLESMSALWQYGANIKLKGLIK
jgi:acyl transferase domain-containing protein